MVQKLKERWAQATVEAFQFAYDPNASVWIEAACRRAAVAVLVGVVALVTGRGALAAWVGTVVNHAVMAAGMLARTFGL